MDLVNGPWTEMLAAPPWTSNQDGGALAGERHKAGSKGQFLIAGVPLR
jgi:hypothetical protein